MLNFENCERVRVLSYDALLIRGQPGKFGVIHPPQNQYNESSYVPSMSDFCGNMYTLEELKRIPNDFIISPWMCDPVAENATEKIELPNWEDFILCGIK